MRLTAQELLALHPIEVWNRERLQGSVFTGVSTDSRTVKPGDLFVALKGEQFDGHAFLDKAFAAGALGALVQHAPQAGKHADFPLVLVNDSLKALGDLAWLYRNRFSIPVLAVGGSNGKTTTKEMIAAVLGTTQRVLGTEGNLNNQIGVPQTLFRLTPAHDLAVVEIGTNHPGEISYLCSIVNPTHGLVTNIGREHLEFFKSVEGVKEEEGALYEYLASRRETVAFVNVEDPRVVSAAAPVRKKVRFGFSGRGLQLRGRNLLLDTAGCGGFRFLSKRMRRGLTVQLAIPGRHNAVNALAAAAVGVTFGVPSGEIREALQKFRPLNKRMERLSAGGVLIINDTYNANPDSMIAALQVLAATEVQGKRIAVLGDMRELGEKGAGEHERIGVEVSRQGIEFLLTYGDLAKGIYETAKTRLNLHYDQKNVLAEYLVELVTPGDAVLVKGSRGMKMEDIVTFLVERLKTTAVAAG